MKNRPPFTPPAIFAAAALALAVNGAQAASFVNEATRVVEQVTDQGKAANSEIDAFYEDFSPVAARMLDLEARVERWKTEGYLCERYADCAEKYDLIYASYAQSMAEIQQAFERHQDGILAALSRFNRVVYQGKDKLSDLRSDDLAALPAEIGRLRGVQERLKTRNAELRQECPERTGRECIRKWRAFDRDLRRSQRAIRRAAYARQIARLRSSMLERLDGVLDRYSDIEEESVATLTKYAFIFEEYGGFSGSEGIGRLLASARDLAQLDTRRRQMQDISEGLEVHVLETGKLFEDRIGLLEGEDLEVGSRREVLIDSGNRLEANDRLLRELEQELEG